MRADVIGAWRAEFNEELTPTRYAYYAYDPEHDRQRAASYERVLGDAAHQLRLSAESQVSRDTERAWDLLETIRTDPRLRTVTGATALRMRSDSTGEWGDQAVIHEKPPEGLMREALHLIGRLTEARVKLAIAMRVASGGTAGTVTAGAAAAGSHAEVTVVVEKAQPFVVARDDDEPRKSHFTQAQVDALIAQEGCPFGIPEDDSFSHAESMKIQRLALADAEAREAAGLLPGGDRVDAGARDAEAEMRREMMRGVVLDEAAVADADAAARSVPSVR